MNRRETIALLTLLCTAATTLPAKDADTLKVVDIEEIEIVSSPKENRKLRELPVSSTLLSQEDMQRAQITSVKGLTAVVPNLFIPDYGTRLTSAVYIRGIGSRINTPAVGLYVDNIPYIDKSAFDFSYAEVESIDVLRGPQSTLYGRNTMGGLIKVHTKSPFSYQGTDLRIGAGTHNAYHGSLTHYHRISERFAFSAGGFYDYDGGFFRNVARDGERADKSRMGGGRIRGIWLPSQNWKVDFAAGYEYSDQSGYPYAYIGAVDVSGQPEELAPYIGTICNDEGSSYYRNLLNAGLSLEYQAKNFTLSSVTGYQFLKDRMFMDQDFTPLSIFNLEQKQRINTVSEEVTLKSKPGRRWQWTMGASGFYQQLHTESPVTFHRQGIENVIEENANSVFDAITTPSMHLGINNESLRVGGSFDTPTLSAAIFHQSTVNDLLADGLSLTVGLRIDYEKMQMDYNSAAAPTDFDFSISMPPYFESTYESLIANAAYIGKESTDYVQLLPKFALQYEWDNQNNVYLTATRGYRSGGYNVQMFSDLITGLLRNSMIDAIGGQSSMAGTMIEQMGIKGDLPDVREATRYKPEHTWNYEAGAHLCLIGGRLQADVSAFCMDTRDQQVSRFSENGLGRVTLNAGKSRSYGAELAVQAAPTAHLLLDAAYGYTHATFKEYETNVRNNGEIEAVDYGGKYVPFVPKHTLDVGGQYTFVLRRTALLDHISLDASYRAAGRIYWTEENNVSQPFYGTLNARISLCKGNGQVDFWVQNLLDKDYTVFYFESMGNGFAQKGHPIRAGIELRCRF